MNQNIYLEGITFIIKYIVNNCEFCDEKDKKTMKIEKPKQVLAYYPRQRYIIDLSELPIKLKKNCIYSYLFNIIDHFSKFVMSYL